MRISVSVAIILGIIFSVIIICLYKNRTRIKKVIYSCSLIFLVTLLLELFLFNYSSYKLLFKDFNERHFNMYEVKLNNINKDSGDKLKCRNNASIEILDLNEDVGTIKVCIRGTKKYTLTIDYSDETSKDYYRYSLPEKTAIESYDKSNYISCSFSGNVNKLKINLSDIEEKESFEIVDISINEPIPIVIELPRILVVFGFVAFFYLIFNLNVFLKPYEKKNVYQNIIYFVTVLAMTVLIFYICDISGEDVNAPTYSQKFVNAIISGQTYLEEKPDERLNYMENPYDYGQRGNMYHLWDTIYYKGNYYVYFGIVPALLVLVPYKLITGDFLTLVLITTVCAIICNVFIAMIIKKIFSKHMNKVPFSVMLMSYIIFVFASGILWLCARIAVYEVVSMFDITFTMIGLYLFICAIENKEKIRYIVLSISCLCLALAVGCRPTSLLYSLLIIPFLLKIFIDDIKSKNKVNAIKLVLAVAIPYLVVGISLMIYNYVRFGSIFEFGSNYQLTVNDIGKVGFRLEAGITGAVQAMFNFPKISWEFPYVEFGNFNLKYYAYYWKEWTIAGVIWLSPIIMLSLLLPAVKKYIPSEDKKSNPMYKVAKYTLIIGILMAIIVSAIGGIVPRYQIDFLWLFNISGIIVFYLLFINIKSDTLKIITSKVLFFVMVFTIFINITSAAFMGGYQKIKNDYPNLFYHIRYMTSFWE